LVGESNELNNLVQSAVFVIGPDLALVDLQMSPPSPVTRGQVVEADAIVSNLGEEAAGQFNVSYYVMATLQDGIPTTGCAGGTDCSSALVTRVLVPGLAVDGFERIVCNLDTVVLSPGSYVLRAVAELVDVIGKVPEHSLANNSIEIPFVVVEGEGGPGGLHGGPADLAVQQVLVSPNIVSAGETGTAWVLVSNVGPETVGPFDVAFVFADSDGGTMALATHFAGTIEPGETDVRIDVHFPTTALSTGTVTLTATLDPANLLPETNRGNNVGTRTFRIR
jgi:hypothetical protein